MTYKALYREYRPQRLSGIVGQKHVAQTLSNAITLGRVAQAYLFCGPRGTGKTTVARILAMALNCENGPTPEPCGECENCKHIAAGFAMDVTEIDAASNRGIDEIRDLRDKVRFAPAEGKYKVYIIDEVHMLTAEAFNALLKTLEEPPQHVVFVLATTEPQRLPATILSRCQRFDFHRFSVDEIGRHLKVICEGAALKVTPAALDLIARKADGGMRDALSLLDQTVAYAGDEAGVEDVHAVLGTTRDEALSAIVRLLAAQDARGIIEALTAYAMEGRDLKQFAKDLLRYCRDLLLCRIAADPRSVVDAADTTMELLTADAVLLSEDEWLRIIETLAAADADLRWSTQPQLLLEVTLIRLARPAVAALAPPQPAPSAPPTVQPAAASHQHNAPAAGQTARGGASAKPPQSGPAPAASAGNDSGVTIERVRAAWPQILEAVKKKRRSTHALLSEGRPESVEGHVVHIVFGEGFAFHKDNITQGENSTIVTAALAAALGGTWGIRCTLAGGTEAPAAGGGQDDPLVRGAIEMFGADVVRVKE